METLIHLLKQIDENESSAHDQDDILMNEEIETLATDLLITNEGACNWENINILRDAGFAIIPIEKDSFGWLLAGILTKKGIITYG